MLKRGVELGQRNAGSVGAAAPGTLRSRELLHAQAAAVRRVPEEADQEQGALGAKAVRGARCARLRLWLSQQEGVVVDLAQLGVAERLMAEERRMKSTGAEHSAGMSARSVGPRQWGA